MRDVLILFGMQGSGKGTQGERIKERYGKFTDIIVGQLLREKAKTDPEIGEYYDTGKLFPAEIVEPIIAEKINALSGDEKILFDGFPRNKEQLGTYKNLSDKYDFDTVAVNILIDEKESLERLSKRYVCPNCEYMKVGEGDCPKCGTKLELRRDDADVSVIKKRIGIFKKDTQPVINYFKEKGELIEIDGIGTFDEVTERVFKELDKHYKPILVK